jgi:iron complex outermembrane receptor protein
VGFRGDWEADDGDSWTLQGDGYAGKTGELQPAINIIGRPGPQGRLTSDVSGGNLLARWRHRSSDRSDLQLRAYYDVTRHDDASYLDTLQTFDLDLQQHFVLDERHDLVWGAAYRLTSHRNRRGDIFALDPEQSDDNLFSGFVQDRISVSEQVELTLGTKLEHNDFSGFEVQPSLRLSWAHSPEQVWWMAVSRAVRVPTRLERDIAIDVTDPAGNPVIRLLGNRDFGAERLVAYETGYRWQPLGNLSFDLALFYNDYDRLSSLELGDPFLDDDGRVIIPVVNRNLTRGHALGAELLAEWQPTNYWRLSASYSGLDLRLESAGLDANRGVWAEGSTPRGQATLRSLLNIGRFEVDAQLRHLTKVRRMPVEVSGEGIDAYSELDLRVGWRISDRWRLSLVGQNLLDDQHVEFGPVNARGALRRAAYLKAEWRQL